MICSLTFEYQKPPKMGPLANSGDPDEILHNAAFHQVLYFMKRHSQSPKKEIQWNFRAV